jgi:mono/diheme cytochrome c family protein
MAAIYGNVGNLSDPAVHQRLPTAAMMELVKAGKGKMPGFGPVLSAEQLADVVSFAQTLKR